MRKKWTQKKDLPAETKRELKDYPELICKLLFYRGITSKKEAEVFLNPDYERDILDPLEIKGMEKAVERIILAIEKDEKIAIFGDYDSDGIPGTAIFHTVFKKLGFENFILYVPDRYKEKYGLNIDSVNRFYNHGVSLIITVDCGTNDITEIEEAKSLGMDVIVVDHHIPQERPHPAYAFINPKQKGDVYSFKHNSGAGVAFKLAQSILRNKKFDINPGWEKWLLDLVAISTICDMVPLVGENRAVVYFGLKVLRKSPRIGIKTLLKKQRVKQKMTTEDDVAFSIGPRINTASRMGDRLDALRLLITEEEEEAKRIVDRLEAQNQTRRDATDEVLNSVEKELLDRKIPQIIVTGNKDWRLGVLGLSCNRLVEKYAKPVCLWTINHEGEAKGSFRSDGTVNALNLFNEVGGANFFSDYGGHAGSGGFSLSSQKTKELEEKLISAYQKIKTDSSKFDQILIDEKLNLDDVNEKTYNQIEKLSPFGMENPKPQFLFENIRIANIKEFGKNGNVHLELVFDKESGGQVSAVAFFTSKDDFDFVIGKDVCVDLVATVEKSNFGFRPQIRLRIVDLGLAS